MAAEKKIQSWQTSVSAPQYPERTPSLGFVGNSKGWIIRACTGDVWKTYSQQSAHHQLVAALAAIQTTRVSSSITIIRGNTLAYYWQESWEYFSETHSFRPRVATMPSPSHCASHVICSCPDTSQRVFSYSLIANAGVTKTGEYLRIRRNHSNNSVSSFSSRCKSRERTRRQGSHASVTSSDEPASSRFTVAMLGAAGIGKTSLTSQFFVSEPTGDLEMEETDFLSTDQTVSIIFDGEESDLTFFDFPSSEKKAEPIITEKDVDAYVVVYSITDRRSFCRADAILSYVQQGDFASDKAVILVGNKTDLVRSRIVSTDEGKLLATTYGCKFVETSDWMNHNVDELLVGIFSQIRLKQQRHERQERKHDRVHRYKGSKTSLFRSRSFVRDIFRKLYVKSRSCDNLFLT